VLQPPSGHFAVHLPPKEKYRVFSMLAFSDESWLSLISSLLSIALVELLLSIDNLLIILGIVRGLPQNRQRSATRAIFAGGLVVRLGVLAMVSLIMENAWVRYAGAFYLIFLCCDHLGVKHSEREKEAPPITSFTSAVLRGTLVGVAFAVDNVVGALGISNVYWLVVTGVIIATVAMFLLTKPAMRVMDHNPILEKAGYLVIGLVGAVLVFEELNHSHIPEWIKCLGIVLMISLSLWYGKSEWLQRVCTPYFVFARLLMRGKARFVRRLFHPVRWALSLFRHPTPSPKPALLSVPTQPSPGRVLGSNDEKRAARV
jgi:predicted tellurium resistance membrane protein TerC